MLRLAADENIDNDIVRGLLRRRPDLDIVRVQDVGLRGADDPSVLAWAANEHRLLLTHDATTVTKHVYARIRDGQPSPGVVEVSLSVPVGQAIQDLLLLVECSLDDEWNDQVVYLPL